ncbi:MAG: hypothetical protein HY291_14990 [Planctomycetes bacterium]|nr:hypothetical protein [Planctomycetota bacterium]
MARTESMRFMACVAAVSACLMALQTLRAEVQEPWVTTDRTVDCSSYETILKGVLKDGMTDEQKALTLYWFFRQRVYHYMNVRESRDPLVCVNVLGNTLCGSQGTCMKGLLLAAGIKARVVSGPGHTFYEAFYDGQWHGFDTFMNFYVMTRGDKPHVASFQELEADPTLISTAAKENRCPPGMAMCGDDPLFFSKHVDVSDYEVMKLDWSVKKNSLRKGEELVRSWWPGGMPLPGTYNPKLGPGPLHTCGSHDRADAPEMYKFWEPYGIPKLAPSTSVSYRHYFNGVINYAPNLATADYKDGLVSESGVKAGAEGLSGAGELVVPVKCSFYISAGQCLFEATCPGEGDAVTLSVSRDGTQWTEVVAGKEPGKKVYAGSLNAVVVNSEAGLHAYRIKFALKGTAVLNHYLLQTYFTHNAMAAPHLMPGKNQVTVSVAKADTLAGADLKVLYRYREAPGWNGEIKTLEKEIKSNPFTFEAALPEGEKLPQMLDLTLRSGTLAWTAEKAWPAPMPPGLTATTAEKK